VEGEMAKIFVKDNGIGFDPLAKESARLPSFGLESMRERAEGIGGNFAILSELGRGTTVEVSLPLGSYVQMFIQPLREMLFLKTLL